MRREGRLPPDPSCPPLVGVAGACARFPAAFVFMCVVCGPGAHVCVVCVYTCVLCVCTRVLCCVDLCARVCAASSVFAVGFSAETGGSSKPCVLRVLCKEGKASLILHFLPKKVPHASSCAAWGKFGRMPAVGARGIPEHAESP